MAGATLWAARRAHARALHAATVHLRQCARPRAQGRDPAAFLANNDATGFFEPLNALITPGPTFTNVNDFRAILVDTAKAGTA